MYFLRYSENTFLHLFYLSSQITLNRNFCYILELYIFSGTPVTCYLLSFGSLVVKPVHFLLTGNIKMGNQWIII